MRIMSNKIIMVNLMNLNSEKLNFDNVLRISGIRQNLIYETYTMK